MARGAEDRPNIDRDGRERSKSKKKRGKGPASTERGRESRSITVTCPECERRFKIKHRKHMMFNCPGCGLEGELE